MFLISAGVLWKSLDYLTPLSVLTHQGLLNFFHSNSLSFCFSDPELSADLKPSQVCNILSQFVIFLIQKRQIQRCGWASNGATLPSSAQKRDWFGVHLGVISVFVICWEKMVWKKTTQFEQPLLVEAGGGVSIITIAVMITRCWWTWVIQVKRLSFPLIDFVTEDWGFVFVFFL